MCARKALTRRDRIASGEVRAGEVSMVVDQAEQGRARWRIPEYWLLAAAALALLVSFGLLFGFVPLPF